jgi:hypothetical protein
MVRADLSRRPDGHNLSICHGYRSIDDETDVAHSLLSLGSTWTGTRYQLRGIMNEKINNHYQNAPL